MVFCRNNQKEIFSSIQYSSLINRIREVLTLNSDEPMSGFERRELSRPSRKKLETVRPEGPREQYTGVTWGDKDYERTSDTSSCMVVVRH